MLPIRDEGTLEFVQAWGPRSVRNDVWVGLRKKKYTRIYDPSLEKPLQETITEDLAYSDGEVFDVDNDYKIGATLLRGECFGLKSSENMELRDYKCSREIGFICEWQEVPCANETGYQYSRLGPISSGRNCFGRSLASGVSSFADGTCNSVNDLLRERWTPKSVSEIDIYRRAYRYDQITVN